MVFLKIARPLTSNAYPADISLLIATDLEPEPNFTFPFKLASFVTFMIPKTEVFEVADPKFTVPPILVFDVRGREVPVEILISPALFCPVPIFNLEFASLSLPVKIFIIPLVVVKLPVPILTSTVLLPVINPADAAAEFVIAMVPVVFIVIARPDPPCISMTVPFKYKPVAL